MDGQQREPAIRFRPIRPEDEAFLYQVYASTRAEELAPLDWDAAQKEAFLRMQFQAQHRHYQTYFAEDEFLVILQDNQPIGRMYIGRWEKEIRLIDISLLPEYRGRGIGTSLLQDLLREGEASGKPVRIHVERFNPALCLYQRLGFIKIEDRGVYDLMEWTPGKDSAIR
ncbi:MAG: GNAT family N-acetyltransferase [bacterium]